MLDHNLPFRLFTVPPVGLVQLEHCGVPTIHEWIGLMGEVGLFQDILVYLGGHGEAGSELEVVADAGEEPDAVLVVVRGLAVLGEHLVGEEGVGRHRIARGELLSGSSDGEVLQRERHSQRVPWNQNFGSSVVEVLVLDQSVLNEDETVSVSMLAGGS